MYIYETNCVSSHADDLEPMIDGAREITWETFRKHVHVSEVQRVFSNYSYRGEKINPETGEATCEFHIKDDYAVSFCKSKFKGKPCYYIRWSAIEYIFTERDKI